MTEMVERVARAICKAEFNDPDLCVNEAGKMPPIYVRLAIAAIAAMREPTETMTAAGWKHTADPCWQENVGNAWRAMIDAELAEEGK